MGIVANLFAASVLVQTFVDVDAVFSVLGEFESGSTGARVAAQGVVTVVATL